MILKALYDYYYRCKNLPKKGIEFKEIGYLIIIKENGLFVRLESRMIDKKTASSFCVLKSVIRSGKNYVPNFFWDNYEYIIGGNEESQKKLNTFKILVQKYNEILPENRDINAISLFYKNYENIEDIIKNDILFQEIKKSKKNISFLLEGSTTIIAENEEIINSVLQNKESSATNKRCLITGNKSSISRLHTKITLNKEIPGALVALQKSQGYDSYGKQQGLNAPVSEDAEFAYTTALNYLLRDNSRNKFLIGNRTFVFWASNNNEASKQVEESIWNLFGFNDTKEDDPNKNIENVRKVFNSIYSGEIKTTLEDKFYILGLAPNAARIAVTYWAEIPLADFAKLIKRHFDDMDIIDCRKVQKPYMGLHSILSSVTLKGQIYGDDSKLIPNLPEAVVKSIFQGIPYPQTLYASCIRRIHAETSNEDKDREEKNMKKNAISITRAAIIKAYLNRLNNNEQKITFMLDKTNTNQGYLCGRLFAVLDKIQGDANNQHSIKERYMNAASTTPATVFSTILNLSTHHSENLNEGKKIFFKKIKQEIIQKIDSNGFPTHLDLQDQGRFFVGYYHQIQSFYNTNEEQPENK